MHPKPLTRSLRLLTIVSPLLILMGCFGEGDGKKSISATPVPSTTGIFVDSPVSGAAWETSGGESGFTSGLGEFTYVPGDNVTFSVGGIVLGTAQGAPIITVVELTGSNNPSDQAAINQLVFLQSIDDDMDPTNGIGISSSTQSAAAGQALDFNNPDFSTAVAAVVAAIAPGNTVVSKIDALNHFYTTFADLGGTDTFSFSFPGFPPTRSGVTYALAFADEFDAGTAPDPEKWNYELGYGDFGWGNNEWQQYTDSPDNVRIEDGNLVIQARCDTPPCGVRDGSVTSGRINTKDKFEFRYGSVIARIKPPVGDGAWPAFWSLGAVFPDTSWPRAGEIDFMEMHNAFPDTDDATTHFTIHWCDETVNPSLPSTAVCFGPENGWIFDSQSRQFPFSLGDDFHLFEADWDQDRIIGRIDGIEYFRRTIDAETMEEFLRQFFMILNVAMGGTLGSDQQPPDVFFAADGRNEVWPQTMLVDYVRVFQRTDDVLDQIDLPITFDDPTIDYTVTDFGEPVAAMTTLVPDPDDADNTVASTTKPAMAPIWAGTTMSTPAGFVSPIPFSDVETTIGVRVYSPAAGIPVRLKADDMVGEDAISVEVELITTAANEWETLVFDFANEADGSAALDLETSYRVLSIFFDFGTEGDGATYLWDDVEFGLPVPDTTAPTLTAVSIESSNANPALAKTGDVVTISLTASESISAPMVTIGGIAADSVNGLGGNWVASRALTGAAPDGLITFSIAYEDLAGNVGTPVSTTTNESSVTIDTTAPMVSIEGAPGSFSTLDPINIGFEFTEPVVGFSIDDIQVTNSVRGGFATIDADSYSVNITPTGNGDVSIAVAAGAVTDLAGNLSEMAMGVTIDNNLDADAPFLSSVSIASNNTNPAFARTGDVVIVTLMANEDINMPTVTIAGSPAESVTGADDAWQASRPMLATDAEGAVTFAISFEDLGGNAGPTTTVTTDESTVTFDITAPTLSITGVPDPVQSVDPFTVTFQFSEDVSGFTDADITVDNGSAADFMAADDATYTADITPGGSGELVISVEAGAATDLAGNDIEADSVTTTVDLQPFWQQVWFDNFDGVALGPNWTARTDADCPDPCDGVQSYRTESVSVAAGQLTIQALAGTPITSGLIDTRGNRELRYGRIEIDAKMPTFTAGVTPSFRMLPVTGEPYGPWPLSGEIDIAHAPNAIVLQQRLRYGLPEPENTTATTTSGFPAMHTTEFRTYAIEWEGSEIRWFADGVHVASQVPENWYAYSEDDDGVYTLGAGAAPFDQPFYLLIGLDIDSAGGAYPRLLEVDAVRVYQCANPDNPDLGTGCADLIDEVDPGIVPVVATNPPHNSEPYTEQLEVYTDTPAMLDFVDPGGMVTSGTLVPGTFNDPGVTVGSTIDADDDGNTVWNVSINANSGTGGVLMGPADLGASPGYFDLSGGATAGEVLFRMRVTQSANNPLLQAKIDSDDDDATGSGVAALEFTADGVWRQYSVKIADLVTDSVMQGATLDIANLVNLFALQAVGGEVNLDLDDIQVKVACRDIGRCEATPRIRPTPLETEYSQDFESMIPNEMMVPNSLSDDGWVVFGSVFDEFGNFVYGYGTELAPNGGPAFSAIVDDQGGVEQGMRQLSIYSDYNNADHGNNRFIEASVFRERLITADDVGRTITFSFDAKAGNIELNTTANAFIKTIDPGIGFALTNFVPVDMTNIPLTWMRYEISLEIDAGLVDQLLQIGFSSTATNFEGSGIFYDNVLVEK